MSRQQIAWRKVRHLNRLHSRRFVVITTHPNGHSKLAIDTEGVTWQIDGDNITPSTIPTTVAHYIAHGETISLSRAWIAEIDRRRAEVLRGGWDS